MVIRAADAAYLAWHLISHAALHPSAYVVGYPCSSSLGAGFLKYVPTAIKPCFLWRSRVVLLEAELRVIQERTPNAAVRNAGAWEKRRPCC